MENIFICRQISSLSVALLPNTDMLISVAVTSNLDVGRTGYSLSMPFRIKLLPPEVFDAIFSHYYDQKTNESFSFSPALTSLLI